MYLLVVWLFEVAVLENDSKSTFMATTDDMWFDFHNRVLARLDSMTVSLVFRLNVGTRAWSAFAGEADYDPALVQVRERALVARTRAVSMEVRNLVSNKLSVMSKLEGLTIDCRPRRRLAFTRRGARSAHGRTTSLLRSRRI
jgi:hypothetical protein